MLDKLLTLLHLLWVNGHSKFVIKTATTSEQCAFFSRIRFLDALSCTMSRASWNRRRVQNEFPRSYPTNAGIMNVVLHRCCRSRWIFGDPRTLLYNNSRYPSCQMSGFTIVRDMGDAVLKQLGRWPTLPWFSNIVTSQNATLGFDNLQYQTCQILGIHKSQGISWWFPLSLQLNRILNNSV